MNNSDWDKLVQLVKNQRFGILGTSRDGHAYITLVAYSSSENSKHLYFATTRSTRKYQNINQDNMVSLLIDNRAENELPLYNTIAITANGFAREIKNQNHPALNHYITTHPQLKSFVESPTTAFFEIKVEKFQMVQRFQNVTEFNLEP